MKGGAGIVPVGSCCYTQVMKKEGRGLHEVQPLCARLHGRSVGLLSADNVLPARARRGGEPGAAGRAKRNAVVNNRSGSEGNIVGKVIGTSIMLLGFLAMMGFAGWIEGGMQ